MSFWYIIVLIFAIVYGNDVGKLEQEFIKGGAIVYNRHTKNNTKTWDDTIADQWNVDRQSALCERALNDSRQFEGGREPAVTGKTLVFKVEKYEAVNVTVLKCPTALKKYIYESPRETDCYLIMTEAPASRNMKDDEPIYIEREVCGLGLMK